MNSFDLDAPQLGEHVWHAFTADPNIDAESLAHRDRVEAVIAAYLPGLDWPRARVLEVGAYRHYSGHLLASAHGAECVVTDIAAAALRDGRNRAHALGERATALPVVCDFHDFPFSTDGFDVVFVAASVHHSRRPEQVLREMLRVVKPGGLLIVANEPCARACCFHAFACNRAESLTSYEAGLDRAGLLPTLSSPFWGARPEHLFGMVENDRIPLSLYMDTLGEAGVIVERGLSTHALVGPFERELMALTARGADMQRAVRLLLRAAVDRARADFGDTERRLDYRLPSEGDIHALAGTVARLLENRPPAGADDEWRAEIFGAALSAVVRKSPARAALAAAAPPLFRRDMTTEADGLVRERPDSGSLVGQLAVPLLPDLNSCRDGATLEPWFPGADWQWVHAENGERSMANLSAVCRIDVPPRPARALLLIRYFAVVTEGQPYRVRIWTRGRLLDDQAIVLQESRLVRAWLPEGSSEIFVEIATEDDAPMDLAWRIRIGVCQLFDVGTAAASETPAARLDAVSTIPSTPIEKLVRVEQVTDAEFYVGDLFRRQFASDPPDYPRHFVAFYRAAPNCDVPVGYIHYTIFDDNCLCGGIVDDQRALQRMPAPHQAVIRQAGGLIALMLRETFARLGDMPAIWAHVGDGAIRDLCLAAGFAPTGKPPILVKWTGQPSEEAKAAHLARIVALGPF